jgi:hypothetical protein
MPMDSFDRNLDSKVGKAMDWPFRLALKLLNGKIIGMLKVNHRMEERIANYRLWPFTLKRMRKEMMISKRKRIYDPVWEL